MQDLHGENDKTLLKDMKEDLNKKDTLIHHIQG